MIIDGHWKWELQKLSWTVSVFCKFPVDCNFAEHQLSRAILYSSIILRKVIEEQTEADKYARFPLQTPEILTAEITAVKYPYIEKEDWTIRGKIGASNYSTGETVFIKARDVCNWLIHSYVWGIVHYFDQRGYAGFFVASDRDKEKFVHYISFDEWRKVLTKIN